jgi:hypothetical protein
MGQPDPLGELVAVPIEKDETGPSDHEDDDDSNSPRESSVEGEEVVDDHHPLSSTILDVD